jgi:hypothetical protein
MNSLGLRILDTAARKFLRIKMALGGTPGIIVRNFVSSLKTTQ